MKTKLLIAMTSALALSACKSDYELPSSGNSLGSVALSGDAIIGSTLSADITEGNGFESGNVTYTWLLDGVAISGASSSSYTVLSTDEGAKISLNVSYVDNDGYSEIATSSLTDTIEFPAVPSEGSVEITGDAYIGFELTAEIIDDNGSGDTSIDYTWLADGVVIADANEATYMLTAADEGKTISVTVSYLDNDGFEEASTSYPTAAITEKPADIITSKVASITDTMDDDAGELRYKHSSAIEEGKLTVSFAKDEVLTADGSAKEAYIALYGNSTSTAAAIVDLRIGNGTYTIRNSDIAVTSTFTPGEWIDVEMTWDASSASESVAPLVTISINGSAVTTEAFNSVSEDLASVMDGAKTVVFKLGDTGSVVTGAYLVDDFTLYSDISGTTVAYSDDFEGYEVNSSLDTDNTESPYDSSTADAFVVEVIRAGTSTPTEPEAPSTTRGKFASITDTMTDDAGELRFKGAMLAAGKLTASFNKAEGDEKDAYIGLYGNSTSVADAVIDLRIKNGVFEIRNNETILSAVTFKTDEWHDIEITWDSSSTTEVTSLNLSIDGEAFGPFLSATTETLDLTTDGVSTVVFKLGDNGGVASTAFLVDDIKLYSDVEATVEVFSDDFEGYSVGDSLAADNSASPYNSNSAEVVVGQ